MAKNDDDPIGRLANLVETLLLNQSVQGDAGVASQLTALFDRLAEQQGASTALMAQMQKTQARPSNQVAPMKSVFNQRGETLEGYTKPVLCCEMMIPWRAEDESLTREEVELLNILAHNPGAYVVQRTDDTRIKISVVQERDESDEKVVKMTWKHETAFRNEYKGTMPALRLILRQMLDQASEEARVQAKAVLTMPEEAALIAAGKLSAAA